MTTAAPPSPDQLKPWPWDCAVPPTWEEASRRAVKAFHRRREVREATRKAFAILLLDYRQPGELEGVVEIIMGEQGTVPRDNSAEFPVAVFGAFGAVSVRRW